MIKYSWVFKSPDTINGDEQDNSNCIELKCTRVKDAISGKECFKIAASRNGEFYGHMATSLLKISDGLYSLRDYGLVLKQIDIVQIRKIIEDNYYNIKLETDGKEEISEFCKFIVEYIEEREELFKVLNVNKSDIEKRPEANILLVNEFRELIENSRFAGTNLTDLKMRLAQEKYIECNKGRLDKLVRLDAKLNPVRAMVFNMNKLKEAIEKM